MFPFISPIWSIIHSFQSVCLSLFLFPKSGIPGGHQVRQSCANNQPEGLRSHGPVARIRIQQKLGLCFPWSIFILVTLYVSLPYNCAGLTTLSNNLSVLWFYTHPSFTNCTNIHLSSVLGLITKKIQIITDSRAALNALETVEICSETFKNLWTTWHALVNTRKYTFIGQKNTKSTKNMKFILAEQGAKDKLIWPEPTGHSKQPREKIIDLLRKQHDLQWNVLLGMGQTRMFM